VNQTWVPHPCEDEMVQDGEKVPENGMKKTPLSLRIMMATV
jgi:hypothetical protein